MFWEENLKEMEIHVNKEKLKDQCAELTKHTRRQNTREINFVVKNLPRENPVYKNPVI